MLDSSKGHDAIRSRRLQDGGGNQGRYERFDLSIELLQR
jgi:hypothetical protein